MRILAGWQRSGVVHRELKPEQVNPLSRSSRASRSRRVSFCLRLSFALFRLLCTLRHIDLYRLDFSFCGQGNDCGLMNHSPVARRSCTRYGTNKRERQEGEKSSQKRHLLACIPCSPTSSRMPISAVCSHPSHTRSIGTEQYWRASEDIEEDRVHQDRGVAVVWAFARLP